MSPASCAVAHCAWRSCPGSKVAGARRLPYLHLSPGVENTWTSGSTAAYAGNAYCCLTTRTAFPVLPILFPCFGLSYLSCSLAVSILSFPPPKKKPSINIPFTLCSSFEAIKRMNVLSYCNGLSAATCGTHGRDEKLTLHFGGNT